MHDVAVSQNLHTVAERIVCSKVGNIGILFKLKSTLNDIKITSKYLGWNRLNVTKFTDDRAFIELVLVLLSELTNPVEKIWGKKILISWKKAKTIGNFFNILDHCAPYLVTYYECRTHYAQCRFWPCARLIKETGIFSVRKPKMWTSFSLKKVR